jgi:hypothetical protein
VPAQDVHRRRIRRGLADRRARPQVQAGEYGVQPGRGTHRQSQLVRRGADALGGEVLRDRGTQLRRPARRWSVPTHRVGQRRTDDLLARLRHIVRCGGGREPQVEYVTRRAGTGRRRGDRVEQPVDRQHLRPGSALRAQYAGRAEVVERSYDRDPADPEPLGQHPFRRQPRPDRQLTAVDAAQHQSLDLLGLRAVPGVQIHRSQHKSTLTQLAS